MATSIYGCELHKPQGYSYFHDGDGSSVPKMATALRTRNAIPPATIAEYSPEVNHVWNTSPPASDCSPSATRVSVSSSVAATTASMAARIVSQPGSGVASLAQSRQYATARYVPTPGPNRPPQTRSAARPHSAAA